jgi:hypothetical protein
METSPVSFLPLDTKCMLGKSSKNRFHYIYQ